MCPPAAPNEKNEGGMSAAKWQTRLERYDSCNSHAETSEPHLSLKRAVFPTNEFCRDVSEENMEHKVHEIVYAYREKQVVREQCFANYVNCQRFWLVT